MGEQVTKKSKSAEQALASLMRLCARAERSSGDALRLMRSWGVAPKEQQKVLDKLIKERFIDDGRYAEAFVREKCNLSGWGARKIAQALRLKRIDGQIIEQSLSQINRDSASEKLELKLRQKVRTIKYKSAYDLRTKLMRYALSLGYEFDMAGDVVKDVLSGICNSNEDLCDDIF